MKVYITDFWFIFLIKSLRRIMLPKLKEDPEVFNGRLENAAMALHIYSSLVLGLFVMSIAIQINDNQLNKYLAPTILICCYVWLYFRHLHKERWMIIEKNIASKFGRRKRDIIFFLVFCGFYFVYSITLIVLFICK